CSGGRPESERRPCRECEPRLNLGRLLLGGSAVPTSLTGAPSEVIHFDPMVLEAGAATGDWTLVSGRAKDGTRSIRRRRSRRASPSRLGRQSDERVRGSHLGPLVRTDKGKAPAVAPSRVELADSVVGAGTRPVTIGVRDGRNARGRPPARAWAR
ncbi:unnamed protein product, partial [Dovyalis caffra]